MLRRSRHGSPIRNIILGLVFGGMGFAAMQHGHILGGALVFLLGALIVAACVWVDRETRAHIILERRTGDLHDRKGRRL